MKGMNTNTAKTTTQVDEDNYLEIMKLAGVGPADDSYIRRKGDWKKKRDGDPRE